MALLNCVNREPAPRLNGVGRRAESVHREIRIAIASSGLEVRRMSNDRKTLITTALGTITAILANL